MITEKLLNGYNLIKNRRLILIPMQPMKTRKPSFPNSVKNSSLKMRSSLFNYATNSFRDSTSSVHAIDIFNSEQTSQNQSPSDIERRSSNIRGAAATDLQILS